MGEIICIIHDNSALSVIEEIDKFTNALSIVLNKRDKTCKDNVILKLQYIRIPSNSIYKLPNIITLSDKLELFEYEKYLMIENIQLIDIISFIQPTNKYDIFIKSIPSLYNVALLKIVEITGCNYNLTVPIIVFTKDVNPDNNHVDIAYISTYNNNYVIYTPIEKDKHGLKKYIALTIWEFLEQYSDKLLILKVLYKHE